MYPLGSFPQVRMRRMRRDDFSRRLMREHTLTSDDLIYPMFVIEGNGRTEKVASMPGVLRHTVDSLLRQAETCLELGVPAVALFPAIDAKVKNAGGGGGKKRRGVLSRAGGALEKNLSLPRRVSRAAAPPIT